MASAPVSPPPPNASGKPAKKQSQQGVVARIGSLIASVAQKLSPDIDHPLMIGTHKESRDSAQPFGSFGTLSTWAFNKMKIEAGRSAAYRDYESMDAEVPEVSTALDIIAEFATQSDDEKAETFRVECDNDKIRKYIEDKVEQLDLRTIVTPMARTVAKYGCCFYELVVDKLGGGIIGVNPLQPGNIQRKEDPYGQLEEIAFEQYDPIGNKVVARFASWQIVHTRYRRESWYIYGQSQLESARRVFKQLQLMEDGMVIGRLYRSHVRFAFFIPIEGMPQAAADTYIDKQREKYKKRQRYNPTTGRVEVYDSPMTAEEDFWFGTRKDAPNGDVKVLQGQGNLQEVGDIEHFQNKLFTALKVPKALMAVERDVNAKATLSEQDVNFARMLRRLQHILASDGIGEIIRRCMILDGINPDAYDWALDFPPISSRDEQRVWTVETLKAGVILSLYSQQGLIDEQYVYERIMELPPDEMQRLLDRIAERKKQAEAQAKQDQAAASKDAATQRQHELQLAKAGAPPVPGMAGGGKGGGQQPQPRGIFTPVNTSEQAEDFPEGAEAAPASAPQLSGEPAGLVEFNPNHDERGRFADSPSAGGAGTLAAQGATHHESPADAAPGGRLNPVDCGKDIEKAAKLLSEGKYVVLAQPDEVSTLVDKMKTDALAAKAAGTPIPNWNLAEISVKNTNLFAQENLGIPRVAMPQVAGWVATGSKAWATLSDSEKQAEHPDANLIPQFLDQVRQQGFTITHRMEQASHLRATQGELDGAKVAAAEARISPTDTGGHAVIVTKDNYILDGHHAWAAAIVHDARDNHMGDLRIETYKLNMDIGTAIGKAKEFQKEWGVLPAQMKHKIEQRLTLDTAIRNMLEGFNPDEPRDDAGKWTDGGGGGAAAGGSKAQYQALKDKWAQTNNSLLANIDHPDSPEAKAKMDELRGIVKDMHRFNLDKGGLEGIGLPGGPRDVAIVGAGPGGLASAIMGATDGLDTLVVDANTEIGGQAKFSSRIENYPGFPIGTTGQRLAQSMYEQATRLGAEAELGVRVTGLTYDPATGLKTLSLSNGQTETARTVILAGGLEFRKLDFPGADAKNVIYGDAESLMKLGAGKPVVVIGGSNGAAQAALGVARTASQVYLMSRSPLDKAMSDYQVEAVHNNPKISVIIGDGPAKFVNEVLTTTGGKEIGASALGVFAGSVPKTDWLPKDIERSSSGKIVVDRNLETRMPGVYAIGDMREGSIGRIGAAVGEGQLAEHAVWGYFDTLKKHKAN